MLSSREGRSGKSQSPILREVSTRKVRCSCRPCRMRYVTSGLRTSIKARTTPNILTDVRNSIWPREAAFPAERYDASVTASAKTAIVTPSHGATPPEKFTHHPICKENPSPGQN